MKMIYFRLFAIALFLTSSLFAKEPDGIFIGVGVGVGQSERGIEHSQVMRHPIEIRNNTTLWWNPETNIYSQSWALAWEVLVGYKHFINDYIGIRYYADIGIQHYKSTSGTETKQKIGLIDYTINADLLIDFYSSERVAFGILGGVGFGGTSFHQNIINEYMDMYNNRSIPIGASNTTKHFFNVNASAGVRIALFKKINLSGGFRICDSFVQGRRSCSSPVRYIGHNFEIIAKFHMLEYIAVNPDILLTTAQNNAYTSRMGYKVKNPYRFTFRYAVEF